MNQDDPKKCTALKLVRLGLVKKITLKQVNKKSILLNPMSDNIPVSYTHLTLPTICSV